MVRSRTAATRSGLVFLVVLVGLSCSGTGSGCSTLTPFPAGTRYMGPKNDNAINIRLSAGGINYLNQNWQTLIGAFAPGGQLSVPVACMAQKPANQNASESGSSLCHVVMTCRSSGMSLKSEATSSASSMSSCQASQSVPHASA